MKKNRNIVMDLLISLAIPITFVLMFILTSAVTLNWGVPESGWWLEVVINCVGMLAFYLPFKGFFERMFMATERIENVEKDYIRHIQVVYNVGSEPFEKWLKEDYYKQRVEHYLEVFLTRANISRTVFDEQYRNNNKAVRKNKELTLSQKIDLIKANKYRKIRVIHVKDILPNTDCGTIFNPLSTNKEREDVRMTFQKILSVIFCGVGTACFVVTSDFSQNWLVIVCEIGIKLAMGLWNAFGAYRVANKVVNKYYVQSLAEKKLVVQDYCAATETKI